jgi:general secretion pathway protein L
MVSTLYIQIPTSSVVESVEQWDGFSFSFCLASAENKVLQHGRRHFSELGEFAQSASHVVLLVAASDVHLLNVSVPPMSHAKIKLALPNLLEEQLLVDSSELIFVSALPKDGRTLVAIVARAWMDKLYGAAKKLGNAKLSAVAISTSLCGDSTHSTVLIESQSDDLTTVNIAVRYTDNLVAGLSLTSTQDSLSPVDVSKRVWDSLQILSPHGDVQLFVDSKILASFQEVVGVAMTEGRAFEFKSIDWKSKISGITSDTFDLFSTLEQNEQKSFDWLRWRWSVALLSMIIIVCLFGLNWEWWKLQRESNQLRASINSTYKTSFPNETVIRDPLVQMQQKINASKKLAGQSTSDDFLVLSAQFASSWDQTLGAQGSSSVATVEYREHSLFVKPKNMLDVPVDRLRSALKLQGLSLEVRDGLLKVSVELGGVR